MDAKQYSKEIEDIYENCCNEKCYNFEKCMALDEREIAIIHMCMETLGNESGLNKENYVSKGLFILLKDYNIGSNECNEDHVKEETVKYKSFLKVPDFSIESKSNSLLAYYSVVLFMANYNCTGNRADKIDRNYFKIYAYVACICAKTFNIFMLNQIYLFIIKTKTCSMNDLKMYLAETEDLWTECCFLLTENNRKENVSKIIAQFMEIISYNEEAKYRNAGALYNLLQEGFLGFDFINGDISPIARYRRILHGIDHFRCYLDFLKNDLQNNNMADQEICNKIDSILNKTKELDLFFSQLLRKEGDNVLKESLSFTDVYDLLNKFELYCGGESIPLICV